MCTECISFSAKSYCRSSGVLLQKLWRFHKVGVSMPQYKLTYFNVTALGEPIRWVFKIAGVEFEDERIELEDWPLLKSSGRFPSGTLPLLQIDNEVFTQSRAILRYLGNEYGLGAPDSLSGLRVDQVVEIVADAALEFKTWFWESDPEKKAAAKETLIAEKFPLFFFQLSMILAKTEGPYIAASKLTYGDLYLANFNDRWLSIVDEDLLQKYPALLSHRDAVLAVPQIAAWVETRPQTLF